MTDYDSWREIAFSDGQVGDFLSIIALPHYEAKKLLTFGSALYKCFSTGFYFFCWSIQKELAPTLAEELLNLAVRVEASRLHPSADVWNQNADEARRLLSHYFGGDEDYRNV